ncbi:MAG: DUF2155 domain-containing protein [Rhodospirillaceae bacterium]|nr:DUF2155 domain-containing protein [Rhodospirillaceae bacterium]
MNPRNALNSIVLLISLVVAGLINCSQPVSAAYLQTDTTVLRWLDKVTGRVSTLEAWVGDTVSIGTLAIEVQTCMTRPPEETPESAAFLKIWDKRASESPTEVFSGWMFASSPALSAMNHAVYDVWVLDCENRRRSIPE